MSTPPTPPSPPTGAATPGRPVVREITLISHSMLYYWWPIWLVGYVCALATYMEDHRLAIVPVDTKVVVDSAKSDGVVTTYEVRVKEPSTKTLDQAVRATATPGDGATFKARISQKAWLGPVFCVVLLVTILITNVPLRGLWSFMVVLILIVLALIISLIPNGWDSLFAALGNLHIYINMAGYFFIATAVFILWAVALFVFDQRTYMRITPGQIAVCEHIGASIRNIDGARVEIEKKRDDLFRHWVWGWGTGDLVIRLSDTKEEIRLPNVWLGVGSRMDEVQRLIREKATVSHS